MKAFVLNHYGGPRDMGFREMPTQCRGRANYWSGLTQQG